MGEGQDKMKDLVCSEARNLLINYLKNNVGNYPNGHLKKDNWMFAVKHSFRVEAIANKIAESFNDLQEKEILTLKVAAILHDIGNVVQREDHGKIGAEIVDKLFESTEYINTSGIDKKKLITIIAGHSNKENDSDRDIISVILKDADILDQIGAMSILMHSTKHNYNEYGFYQGVLGDISKKELEYCEEQYSLLRTSAAKQIMEQKINFIKGFKKQLEFELLGEIENNELVETVFPASM
jgi:putative nucleotidyltransferase with HDIG domain